MTSYITTLTKMTRQICTALAALLMVGAMASCSENENTETALSDNAYLSLSFSSQSANVTRAGGSRSEGVLADNESKADPNSESDIHSIKVWVFQSGTNEDANPIAYKEEALEDINGSYNLQLRFLRKIAGKEVENIDLYILANSESTNISRTSVVVFLTSNVLVVTVFIVYCFIWENIAGSRNGIAIYFYSCYLYLVGVGIRTRFAGKVEVELGNGAN